MNNYFDFCLTQNLGFLNFDSLLDHYLHVGRWCVFDYSERFFDDSSSQPEAGVDAALATPATLESVEAEAAAAPANGEFHATFKMQGAVDQITSFSASGWVWAPDHPHTALQVEVLQDGHLIGRGAADNFRPDLYKHNMGTGRYGFSIRFHETLPGGVLPVFRVLMAADHALDCKLEVKEGGGNALDAAPSTAANLLADHQRFTSRGPAYEDHDPSILASLPRGVQAPELIAFYLPQFHAVPENDEFWGAGFTEWRQLPRALSRFPGHYQPRIPRDLGFYDLTSEEVIRKQVDMALASGISAFGFYYYWFNGRRVLYKPLDIFAELKPDLKFVLIWANENWTRAWDGSEANVLLRQDYREEDEEGLLKDLASYFSRENYLRIDGRPLFFIYNPGAIPETRKTILRWRAGLSVHYGIDPLFFMCQTFGQENPYDFGFDGAMEFPPHKLSNLLPGRPTPDAYSPQFTGRVIAYDDFVKASLDEDEPPAYPLIKTAAPSWDNDCRRPNRGLTLEGVAPKKYQSWLGELINRAMDNPIGKTPVVAINAWNEWAESAYLEPDVHYGAAFLNATSRAYASALRARGGDVGPGERPRVSVILPNYNHAKFLPSRIRSVLDQTVPPDEIIFLDDCSSDDSVAVARDILKDSSIPYRIIVNEENSGGVFRQWLKGLSLAKHDLIWVAETDDMADRDFLSNVLPVFARQDVMLAFGRIACIGPDGAPRNDLDGYFNAMENFSWSYSCVVPAFKAFSRDFAIRNVIPNASGLVFRKPSLTPEEQNRLLRYSFAGDWYFYALVARGGAIAYSRRARSYFRVNPASASRNKFFTSRHFAEHMMIVEDLIAQYGIGYDAVAAHADLLAPYLPDRDLEGVRREFLARVPETPNSSARRVCIAANGFAVGGGEILPIDLANALKARGLHVTYLVVERPLDASGNSIRQRLRSDIPVVYWEDVADDFMSFLKDYGIEIINSHNVSFDYRIYQRKLDLGVPYVASLHGGFETVQDLLTEDFLRFLDRTVSKWAYLSEKNFEFLPEPLRDPGKLLHSFNAVAPYEGEWVDRQTFRADRAIPEDAFVFVLCSRAIESKGWRAAIEIVEGLAKQGGCPVHLVLIGDGPIAAALRSEFSDSQLVTFLGQVDRPVRYFKCFDMGLFPSTFEGETFPLFLLECFQMGLPVVTTDIGEIRRIMKGSGRRPPGITIDHSLKRPQLITTFVRELEKMLSMEGAYVGFQFEALATSARFGITALADLYVDLFANLAREARRAAVGAPPTT